MRDPLQIAYHFRMSFVTNNVTHFYKDGEWSDGISETNTFIKGPGHNFIITFFFDDNEFVVYADDENRNYQYRYPYQYDIADIKYVQVWGDIERMDEIIFRFNTTENYRLN